MDPILSKILSSYRFDKNDTDIIINSLRNGTLDPNHICNENPQFSLLTIASISGNIDLVKELLKMPKINVNQIDNLGWNALIHITGGPNQGPNQEHDNFFCICKDLIDAGINVNAVTKFGNTALTFLLQRVYLNKYKETILLLIKRGAWLFSGNKERCSDIKLLRDLPDKEFDKEFVENCKMIITENIVKEGIINLPKDVVYTLLNYL